MRLAVKWNEVAPAPRSARQAELRWSRPRRLPGLRAFRCGRSARAQDLGLRVLIDLAPDAPRWATKGAPPISAATVNDDPDVARIRRLRRGSREALLGRLQGPPRGRLAFDLERAQPLALPQARASAPDIYREMVARGGAADPGCQRRRPRAGRRDRRGRQPGNRDRAAGVRAAVALPRRSLSADPHRQLQQLQAARAGRLRRITPTARPQRVPKKKDLVSLLVIRRLGRLSGRRRPGGPPLARPADLQHRVRTPEQSPRPDGRELTPPAGGAPEREGGAGLPLPAAAQPRPVPALRRPATARNHPEGDLVRLPDRPALHRRHEEARLGRLPAPAGRPSRGRWRSADLGPHTTGQRRALRAARAARWRRVHGRRGPFRDRRRRLLRGPAPQEAAYRFQAYTDDAKDAKPIGTSRTAAPTRPTGGE